ncbi:uncharacterized protein LOC122815068 [Protopterus annectens]|uniref:uncharacterized protein LOC122815068 n=1 Tax=Protopterus annectens TaxID=7888 RepID=UPI001CFAC34A|nr:uncharacterized protein LOC122815068 [Protopterus annectens]
MEASIIELDYVPIKSKRQWNSLLESKENPLLNINMEHMATTPNIDKGNVDRMKNFNIMFRELENTLYKLYRLTWQRHHLEACLHFKLIPRGMRVLVMPSYGETYPELLRKWQQLNLDLGFSYIKLLIEHFLPIEKELHLQAESLSKDISTTFKEESFQQRLDSMFTQVFAYGDKLQQLKTRKLHRDHNDFANNNVFSWPKYNENRNKEHAVPSIDMSSSQGLSLNQSYASTVMNVSSTLSETAATSTLPSASPSLMHIHNNIIRDTPPCNQQALVQKDENLRGAKPKVKHGNIEGFLPLPLKFRRNFQSRSRSRGRTKRKFSGEEIRADSQQLDEVWLSTSEKWNETDNLKEEAIDTSDTSSTQEPYDIIQSPVQGNYKTSTSSLNDNEQVTTENCSRGSNESVSTNDTITTTENEHADSLSISLVSWVNMLSDNKSVQQKQRQSVFSKKPTKSKHVSDSSQHYDSTYWRGQSHLMSASSYPRMNMETSLGVSSAEELHRPKYSKQNRHSDQETPVRKGLMPGEDNPSSNVLGALSEDVCSLTGYQCDSTCQCIPVCLCGRCESLFSKQNYCQPRYALLQYENTCACVSKKEKEDTMRTLVNLQRRAERWRERERKRQMFRVQERLSIARNRRSAEDFLGYKQNDGYRHLIETLKKEDRGFQKTRVKERLEKVKRERTSVMQSKRQRNVKYVV